MTELAKDTSRPFTPPAAERSVERRTARGIRAAAGGLLVNVALTLGRLADRILGSGVGRLSYIACRATDATPGPPSEIDATRTPS